MSVLTEEQRKLMDSVCLKKNHSIKSSNRRHLPKHKKSGGGGKGLWSNRQLDDTIELRIHPDDPNYTSEEDSYLLVEAAVAESVEEFKGRVSLIINEYFTSCNVDDTAQELRDLGCPDYHHYFVKQLISKAMDQRDREKEKAAVLLSALHPDVISPEQMAKGFGKLLWSVDDLSLDIPSVVDTTAVFLARAVIDGILPPSFLSDSSKILTEGSKGLKTVHTALSKYLSSNIPHAEVIGKWGSCIRATTGMLEKQIEEILRDYLGSGDRSEACNRIRQLDAPYYHHEVVRRALALAVELSAGHDMPNSGIITHDLPRSDKSREISALLKQLAETGIVTSSQMSKGFTRAVQDLEGGKVLESIIAEAIEDGWLSSSFHLSTGWGVADSVSEFKKKATNVIQEYFSSDDAQEVLQFLGGRSSTEQAMFVKRLILVAMDRKNREKEMASALLSAMQTEIDDDHVGKGFVLLLQSAEDTALDIPDAGTLLAFFLSRAVYDNVLSPFNLEEIKSDLSEHSLGREIVGNAKSILSARHAGERILRCWGGGTGWAIEDAKEKVFKIVEEYEAGGDMAEACRCIRELNMPFFHHEIVKCVLEMAMEKRNNRLLDLLQRCATEGLITTSQMCTGFKRVYYLLEDLALDVPNAEQKFWEYVEAAKSGNWLRPDFLDH